LSLEKVVGDIDFGEGPRWHDGRLWYSDFYQGAVFAVDLGGRREQIVSIDDQPSGLGWLPNGDLLLVAMKSRRVLRFDGQRTHVYADLTKWAPGYCNDMVVTSVGHAYVGDFGFAEDDRSIPEPTSLIHIDPAGAIRSTGPGLQFPNGMVIPDAGNTLIVAESVGQKMTELEMRADGSLGAASVFAHTSGRAPDGCTLDDEGAVWFADAGRPGRAVVRVARGGAVLDLIETEDPPYACMLGGESGDQLFVLTAPSSSEAKVSGQGRGALWVTGVEVPSAGLP